MVTGVSKSSNVRWLQLPTQTPTLMKFLIGLEFISQQMVMWGQFGRFCFGIFQNSLALMAFHLIWKSSGKPAQALHRRSTTASQAQKKRSCQHDLWVTVHSVNSRGISGITCPNVCKTGTHLSRKCPFSNKTNPHLQLPKNDMCKGTMKIGKIGHADKGSCWGGGAPSRPKLLQTNLYEISVFSAIHFLSILVEFIDNLCNNHQIYYKRSCTKDCDPARPLERVFRASSLKKKIFGKILVSASRRK